LTPITTNLSIITRFSSPGLANRPPRSSLMSPPRVNGKLFCLASLLSRETNRPACVTSSTISDSSFTFPPPDNCAMHADFTLAKEVVDQNVFSSSAEPQSQDILLQKNKSTSNLLAYRSRPGITIPRNRVRYSLDVDSAFLAEGDKIGQYV
jgi:hypothetical protein